MQMIRVIADDVAEVVNVPDMVTCLVDGVDVQRAADPADFFHPDLGFVVFDGPVEAGWVRKGRGFAPRPAFVPPPPPPREIPARSVMAAISATALVAMRTYADQRVAAGKTGEWSYLYQEPLWLETSPKLARLLGSAGLVASEAFDAVVL